VAGEEYSGRGGGRVYTQMFVLSRELLARFANDPFLILRAMEAAGRLIVFEEVPETLFRLPLVGRCLAAHSECVTDILSEIGATAFDEILSAISSLSSVAVAAKAPLEKLFQAVLQSLSPEERLTLSFTTGLKHSPRRPFKLFAVPCEDSTIRQSQRMSGARIIDLTTAHAA
jgi:hypothetical protein